MAPNETEAVVELRQALNNGEIVPYFQSLVQVIDPAKRGARSGIVPRAL
jgi:hypothetical protein